MLHALRQFAKRNLVIRKLIGYHLASSGFVDHVFRNYKVSEFWENRIAKVLNSSDNAYIPRVPHAGEIKNGKQTMHNGLKIRLGSYYGPEYASMLLQSKGVHEPQEERVFMEVLKSLPAGALMIEMGAFWSFYSMWFNKEITGAVNYMIEPDAFNIGQGKRNFRLNKMKGTFIQAFIGKEASEDNKSRTICIDDFVESEKIEFIHMLHSDIQGFEYEMLQGAKNCIQAGKVGYVFISTHSNELHAQCLDFLRERDFTIIADADLDRTFSEDGLIAAKAPGFAGIDAVSISHYDKK